MAAKTGPWHHQGVRLPVAPLTPDLDDGRIADPAKGEKVPRCAACGMPGPRDIEGTWAGYPVRFPVCVSCIQRVNGPLLDPDPRNVEEAA